MTDTNTQKAPSICDGIEQDAFEAWATENRYDMNTHPLHWLFLNERTDAARDGWKAGLVHAAGRCAALSQPPEASEVDGTPFGYLLNGRFFYERAMNGKTISASDAVIPLYATPPKPEASALREALEYCANAPLSGWTIAQALARKALAQPAPEQGEG